MLSPALKQYVVAGSPLQAMPAQFCGHTGAVGQGPPGGALDMYTQKHTDQVNLVLTTVATDRMYMHKHCAIAYFLCN